MTKMELLGFTIEDWLAIAMALSALFGTALAIWNNHQTLRRVFFYCFLGVMWGFTVILWIFFLM